MAKELACIGHKNTEVFGRKLSSADKAKYYLINSFNSNILSGFIINRFISTNPMPAKL